MSTTRRELLQIFAALGLLSACRSRSPLSPEPDPCALTPLTSDVPTDLSSFRYGVASGDPSTDQVILWTRVEPQSNEPGSLEVVEWVIASDPELREVVQSGHANTTAEQDFTVKVNVLGLEPGTTYYYRFARARYSPCVVTRAMGPTATPVGPQPPILASPIGRTRTLPAAGVEHMRLAFCSCANYPFGYFNVYAAIARRSDLDLVLHLGDYLYEYADGRYGDGSRLGRVPEPKGELVSLADYRARHATYKRDPDLQELHRQHPMIVVWDDHEIANDAWMGGAENHDPQTQGEWAVRKAAAIKAYFEWMPIRDNRPRIDRSFRFGTLAELIMLDTRLHGRVEQSDTAREDPSRTLLGADQEAWLLERLSASKREGVAWRLIGQQVLFAPLRLMKDKPPWRDAWDGYPAARERILDHLDAEGIGDVAVLAGDIHSSWAFEVGKDPWSEDPERKRSRLVEFVTPAVSSPGPVPAERADELAAELPGRHPHLRFVELKTRGYVVVDVRAERLQADWWFVETVDERRADERFAKGFVVERGAALLREVTAPSEAGEARAPA